MPTKNGNSRRIQGDVSVSGVALGFAFLQLAVVVDELDGDCQRLPAKVDVFPSQATRLPSTKTPQRDEIEEGMQRILPGGIEECAGRGGRPHHHGRWLLARFAAARDAFLGPDEGLRTAYGIEFDVGPQD